MRSEQDGLRRWTPQPKEDGVLTTSFSIDSTRFAWIGYSQLHSP